MDDLQDFVPASLLPEALILCGEGEGDCGADPNNAYQGTLIASFISHGPDRR